VIEFEKPRRTTPELNLSALIDITFILVIFIVLAATFSRVRVLDVDLPAASAQNTANDEVLVVTVPEQGPLRFGEENVEFAALGEALRARRATHRDVLLVADRKAAIERAVLVMSEAQQAGFASVAIATQPIDPRSIQRGVP